MIINERLLRPTETTLYTQVVIDLDLLSETEYEEYERLVKFGRLVDAKNYAREICLRIKNENGK